MLFICTCVCGKVWRVYAHTHTLPLPSIVCDTGGNYTTVLSLHALFAITVISRALALYLIFMNILVRIIEICESTAGKSEKCVRE